MYRLKLKQFTFKDSGTTRPEVFDKDGNLWDHKQLISNGSKMRIGFDIYAWKGPAVRACPATRAAQVVEWLAAPGGPARAPRRLTSASVHKAADEAVKAAADARTVESRPPTHR